MARKKKFITCDGNHATAHIAYMFSEVAAIYPITPSSNMAENVDEWAAAGRKNIFGETVDVVEMQSEAGAAGAVHGSLQGGALTSTYTASQGLLLMIPNMYKISGELLPGVFHVSARSLAAQALSIFGDHSDVMSARQTGFAFLASSSVQEAMDLAGVAHLTAIKSRIPFVHFFDGFRTSHEIQKIEMLENEDLEPLIDKEALQAFRDGALSPNDPVTRGLAQNPDIYFQAREAANKFYEVVPDIVADYMADISKITGREYKAFLYYGADDAENVIIAIGSVTETIREVVNSLTAKGEKVGVLVVHLYRPFSAKHFMAVMPKSVKRISVLDRTKEPGANGEPLYLDVKDLYYGKENAPIIVGGRYGLSSKDTTPAMIMSVFDNLKMAEPKNHFTLGIVDDVTFTSLPLLPEISLDDTVFEAKFYGLGSDGTVGANKNTIKIIGDTTDKYCQAYFDYDSKKSGGFTASHLRFGDNKIMSPYLVNTPNFVACHVPAYLKKYDMLKGLKKGGTFLLNAIWDADEVVSQLPNSIKKYMAVNDISMYVINATKLAEDIGLGNRTNTIMQAAFFKIANVIPYDVAVEQMKKMIVKSFGKKGENVVNMNYKAVEAGGNVQKVDVKPEWANLEAETETHSNNNIPTPEFVKNVVEPINNLAGNDLPVSAFLGREDGTFPAGTAQYEKRGVAVNVPEWNADTCIQCNQCSYVCPHAAIRPFLLDEKEQAEAPEGTTVIKANGKGYEGLGFRIQVSTLDCTGCGNCVDVCPSKVKSLEMKTIASQEGEIPRWDYVANKVSTKIITPAKQNVKSSQFAKPLFEFSGACAGCGETPYIKTITQLYGESMMVANATGCSSIYGGSAPSTPYTTSQNGKGVAWANSLFEDNAEFGFGMAISAKKLQARAIRLSQENADKFSADTNSAITEWINSNNDTEASAIASEKAITALEGESDPIAKEILAVKDWMPKRSNWIFGGDGWAYDIGYGGLDHVLASGENVNVLVMDTEIYSNTGGQSSKATPVGAVAKFAASGKKIRKKDLGMMAISYGYVYVAQVAMGANQAQFFKALKEAEAYPGPSLIIAYAPCISHGIRAGMGKTQNQEKLAVEAGYWHMYRFNPTVEAEGKNPFTLDSKEPDWSKFQDFILSEVRYTSLLKSFPEEAKELFAAAEQNAKWRLNSYKRLAAMDYSNE
jgi:pyruvate-ferredoxin/flavodoxin oxidoreductase